MEGTNMNLIEICMPTGNYSITDDGMVLRTTDGVSWDTMGPVVNLKDGQSAIDRACSILYDRQSAYLELLKYKRQDITDAATWAGSNASNELSVAPSPIIAEIIEVFARCRAMELALSTGHTT